MQRRRATAFAFGASKGTTGSALHGLILAGGDHRERCRSQPNISDSAPSARRPHGYSQLAVSRAPMPGCAGACRGVGAHLLRPLARGRETGGRAACCPVAACDGGGGGAPYIPNPTPLLR